MKIKLLLFKYKNRLRRSASNIEWLEWSLFTITCLIITFATAFLLGNPYQLALKIALAPLFTCFAYIALAIFGNYKRLS